MSHECSNLQYHSIASGKLFEATMILTVIPKATSSNIGADNYNPDGISRFSHSLTANSVLR
jgi:hypothetical protein